MRASGEAQETEPLAANCGSCGDGAMGAWIAIRAGSALVLVGDRAVAGRVCERCHSVELQARRLSGGARQPEPRPRRKSAGGELLEGVLGNLRGALEELWRLVQSRRQRSG